jgi:hypothetical protein
MDRPTVAPKEDTRKRPKSPALLALITTRTHKGFIGSNNAKPNKAGQEPGLHISPSGAPQACEAARVEEARVEEATAAVARAAAVTMTR